MRMWMIPPGLLCDKHLLGEHGEIHKHRHNFVKGHSIAGRISPVVQIEPQSMKKRHDVLSVEMRLRGMNHKSPYVQPDVSSYPVVYVNQTQSMLDLRERCKDCKKRIEAYFNINT